MLWKAEKRGPGAAPGCNSGVVVCVVQYRFRLVDRPQWGCRSFLRRARWAAWSAATWSRWVGSSGTITPPWGGDHDPSDPHPPLLRGGRLLMPPPV
jgi:hypothetical protein